MQMFSVRFWETQTSIVMIVFFFNFIFYLECDRLSRANTFKSEKITNCVLVGRYIRK